MNLYYEMLSHPVFSVEDVNRFYNNMESARSAVKSLIRKGLAVKIRNNMYTCISGETLSPIANRYQIASKISPSSCISHHSAMEYYGITDQVYYDVYVSSRTSFREFEFDGYTYCCVKSKFDEGVINVEYSGGIRVTDKERTVIDSIKSLDRIAGLEEVIDNISQMSDLHEEKLKKYLMLYDNKFLFQKAGFLFERLYDRTEISADFLNYCKSNMSHGNRYICSDIGNGVYESDWKLIVPSNLGKMKNGGLLYAEV